MGNIKKKWKVCEVHGYITAVDPGCLNTSSYNKTYMREEMKVGMDLCRYNKNLPDVILQTITDDYIIICAEGTNIKIEADGQGYTPKHGLSYAYSDATIKLKTMTDKEIREALDRILQLYEEMVNNYKELGEYWRNIRIGKEIFEIMQMLPKVVYDEFDTPAEKASIISAVMSQMIETKSPRLCLEMAQYIKELDPDDKDNIETIQQLNDFIDPSLTMEEYCAKYTKTLKFDPIERTEKWEEVIYEVEKECAEILKDEPKGMGFCFSYWSTMAAVLKKHGIDWKSPSLMNPQVMFD